MISFKLRSLNLQRWICCSFDYQVKLWKALIGNVKWVFGSSYLASSFYSNRALRNTSILVFFASMHFSMLSQSSIEVLVDKTDILTCETLQYTLKYSCAGTGNNCPNVTMTASAPTGIIFPSQNIGITSDIQCC